MSYASWLNISIGHGRSGPVYRLWDAVAHRLTGDMAGTWTVVDNSTGGAPTWTNDTSPADASWIVIESQSANADGTKAQVFLGFCNSSASLSGFGTKSAGLYACYSPIGGWTTRVTGETPSGGYFGSALSDWRNSSLKAVAGYTTACTMGLVLTSGDSVTHRPGSVVLLTRSGTSDNTYSHLAGAVRPPVGLFVVRTRSCVLAGTASSSASGGNWGYSGGTSGAAPNTTPDGWDTAYVEGTDYGQDRESGAFVEADLVLHDVTAGKGVGVLDGVRRTSAPNGDTSSDGTRWAWGGFSYPREAARDGVWG